MILVFELNRPKIPPNNDSVKLVDKILGFWGYKEAILKAIKVIS